MLAPSSSASFMVVLVRLPPDRQTSKEAKLTFGEESIFARTGILAGTSCRGDAGQRAAHLGDG